MGPWSISGLPVSGRWKKVMSAGPRLSGPSRGLTSGPSYDEGAAKAQLVSMA